jgi:hypothetical protein
MLGDVQVAGSDVAASWLAHMSAGAGGLVATSGPALLRHDAVLLNVARCEPQEGVLWTDSSLD